MTSLRRTFRLWWQPPRRLMDREAERQVTFLELFYDLVYVVLIAELAHALSGHIDLAGLAGYAFLFIIVWWAWLNGTLYHDLHGNNDIRTRVFTFLQMFTVASIAVFAHDALGETSVGFALSYAAFQLILTYLWWQTGVHDPDHRPLSQPYVLAFLVTTLLFVVSVFVPEPWRFYLWGLALVVSLLQPLVTFGGILGTMSPFEGAQTTLHCLLDDDVPNHNGEYYSQNSILYSNRENRPGGWPMPSPNPHAHDKALAERLYHRSVELVGLEGRQPAA